MRTRLDWPAVVRWWRHLPRLLQIGFALLPVLVAVLVLVLVPKRPSTVPPTPYPTPHGAISSVPPAADTGSPPPLLDDTRLFYGPGWDVLAVRRFLEGRPGTLANLQIWVGDREMPLADIIVGQSLLYGINPQVVLALLEVQSGLIDAPAPTSQDLDWAMGHRDEEARGLETQIRWAVLELFRSTRDYPMVHSLVLENGETIPIPDGTNLGSYAVLRVVAQTGDPALLRRLQGTGESSFVQTFRRLFGEDPRHSWEALPTPATAPFLTQPYVGEYEVTSIFDHHYPFLNEDGALTSYFGEEALGLPYDGHDGWDYALDFGVPIVAAAEGVVAWAGNSDNGCASVARGVVLDHGNGYQTLYWHMDRVDVEAGQSVSRGAVLGLAGASGCANGPHLHFGVHFVGREVDPEGWCGQGADPWAEHPAGAASQWLWADRFSPCQLPPEAIVVDNDDNAFQRTGTRWNESKGAVNGGALWAPSEPRGGVVPVGQPGSLDGVVEAGTWRPGLPERGRYHVYAFVPYCYNDTLDTQAAHYLVHHAEGETLVVVDQALHVDRWVDLGTYPFSAGQQGFVYLDNLTDESGFGVWFDAVMWLQE